MTDAALHLLPYALIAAATPLGLAATLAALRAGRVDAIVFTVGVVVGQLLACGLLVAIGAVTIGERAGRPTLRAVLELGLGLALLVFALVVHRGAPPVDTDTGRTTAVLARLEHVGAATAAAIGVVLGIGGPKRLVLSALAAATIAADGVSRSERAALVLWYGLIATLTVWAPVLAFLVLGDRVVGWVDAGFEWLTRHRRPVTVWSLVVVGGFLVADALVAL